MVTLIIVLLFSLASLSWTSLITEKLNCNWLKPPKNGFFIRGYCSNKVNSACVINCDIGYEAYGSTFRQCLVKNEIPYWTGRNTFCHSNKIFLQKNIIILINIFFRT